VKIAICENEVKHQNEIQSLLQQWAKDSKREISISIFDDSESLIMLWGDVIFDILLLDIEMKKTSGMELAKIIRRIDDNVIIVFITSYASYSLEGYDVNPLHYLIKPLKKEVFFNVLDKAYAIYSLRGGDGIVINTEDGAKKILTDTIHYISISAHYADIYTSDGVYKTRTTIKELAAALPSHFIYCHRSYIINLFKVVCAFSGYVTMNDNTEIPVSKSHTKQVRELFAKIQTR